MFSFREEFVLLCIFSPPLFTETLLRYIYICACHRATSRFQLLKQAFRMSGNREMLKSAGASPYLIIAALLCYVNSLLYMF